MFPGAPASGKGMWSGAAEAKKRFGSDFHYEESITSATAAKRDRFTTKRYERLADTLFQKVKNKKEIVIIAHSMGGVEAVAFLNAIAKDDRYKGKTIDLAVVSPIEYGSKGLDALGNLVSGSARILHNRDTFEAHIAYPLPPAVAAKIVPELPLAGDMQTIPVPKEIPNARKALLRLAVAQKPPKSTELQKKFHTFARTRLPPQDAGQLLSRLETIDASLTQAVASTGTVDQKLLAERNALIKPYIPTLLSGDLIDPSLKGFMHDLYNPSEHVAWYSLLPYIWVTRLKMAAMISGGMDTQLQKVTDTLAKQNIRLHTSLVYLENDRFMKVSHVRKANKQVKHVAKVFIVPEASHFTPAYDTKLFMHVVEQATGRILH